MPRRAQPLLALAALVAAAPALSPLLAQQVQVETRSLQRDSTREVDTQKVFLRVRSSNPEQLMLVVNELQEREQRLIAELRASPAGDPALRRRLFEDLAHLTREKFGVLSIVETRCAAESGPRPAGYIGLNLDSDYDVETRRYRFTVVHSVDPGSPSDRAGLLPGDTLVTFGGRDVRARQPDAAGLLEPGNRLPVRVARGRDVREFTLEVVPRPAGIARSCGEFERVLQPLRLAAPTRFVFEGEMRGSQAVRMQVGTAPGRVPDEPSRLVIFAQEHLSTSSAPYFAGAQFRALDDDWRSVLGLKGDVQGVFVNEVAPGTPTAQAGLKKGDVITRVDDSPATSPMTLVNLLIVTERPEASLQVIRGGERRTLVLRLPQR